MAIVPVPVASYLLNEKRRSVQHVEKYHNVRVVIVPNANMETPHFEVVRVRGGDENTTLSYHLPEQLDAIREAEKEDAPAERVVKKREEPALQSFTAPSAPASAPKAAATVADANKPGLFTRLVSFISGLFTSTEEEQPEAPKRESRNRRDHKRSQDRTRRGTRNNQRDENTNGKNAERGEKKPRRKERVEPTEQTEERQEKPAKKQNRKPQTEKSDQRQQAKAVKPVKEEAQVAKQEEKAEKTEKVKQRRQRRKLSKKVRVADAALEQDVTVAANPLQEMGKAMASEAKAEELP